MPLPPKWLVVPCAVCNGSTIHGGMGGYGLASVEGLQEANRSATQNSGVPQIGKKTEVCWWLDDVNHASTLCLAIWHKRMYYCLLNTFANASLCFNLSKYSRSSLSFLSSKPMKFLYVCSVKVGVFRGKNKHTWTKPNIPQQRQRRWTGHLTGTSFLSSL